ncbi:MAG: hypothetical protein P1V13_05850 [Rhizobiaceae bacterium]|nr:hypothetical protein [Rhizobiaceae bacterium]
MCYAFRAQVVLKCTNDNELVDLKHRSLNLAPDGLAGDIDSAILQIIAGSSIRAHFSPGNVIPLKNINDLQTLVAFAKDSLVAALLMAAKVQVRRRI